MDTRKYFEAIRDGTFDGKPLNSNRISVYALMDVYDINVVDVLYKNSEDFEKLTLTKSWTPGKFRQRRLGESDLFKKFLNDLKKYKCICTKFKYTKPDPQSEEDSNILEILSYPRKNANEKFECKCTNCSKIFEVQHCIDSMGYDDYQWNEKN